eukprot:COSAG06_NODE_4435_length_4270_cov_6.462479_3_plen_137_part_00
MSTHDVDINCRYVLFQPSDTNFWVIGPNARIAVRMYIHYHAAKRKIRQNKSAHFHREFRPILGLFLTECGKRIVHYGTRVLLLVLSWHLLSGHSRVRLLITNLSLLVLELSRIFDNGIFSGCLSHIAGCLLLLAGL